MFFRLCFCVSPASTLPNPPSKQNNKNDSLASMAITQKQIRKQQHLTKQNKKQKKFAP